MSIYHIEFTVLFTHSTPTFLSSPVQLASLYKASYRGKVEFGKSSQFVDF